MNKKEESFDLDEETKIVRRKLIDDCKSHLDNLNHMSVKAKYEQYRIKAIDSYFNNSILFMKLLKLCRDKKIVGKDVDIEVDDMLDEVRFGD